MSEDGLLTIESRNSVKDSIDRLEAALRAKGVTIFARIDHAAGATSAGLTLRPTQVLIFGNPRAGTPLMEANQTIGLDLPLKILAWEDAAGKVRITTDDLHWLAQRHRLGEEAQSSVAALASALANFAKAAAE